MLIRNGLGLSILCRSCEFDYQQRVLKSFTGPGYLCFMRGPMTMAFTAKSVCVKRTFSSCYSSIPWILFLIERDECLTGLCHCCGLDHQQKLQKIFPGPDFLFSKDGVV